LLTENSIPAPIAAPPIMRGVDKGDDTGGWRGEQSPDISSVENTVFCENAEASCFGKLPIPVAVKVTAGLYGDTIILKPGRPESIRIKAGRWSSFFASVRDSLAS
jgi:hypothetical protein